MGRVGVSCVDGCYKEVEGAALESRVRIGMLGEQPCCGSALLAHQGDPRPAELAEYAGERGGVVGVESVQLIEVFRCPLGSGQQAQALVFIHASAEFRGDMGVQGCHGYSHRR